MNSPDTQTFTSKDHDLLIAINVKVDAFLTSYGGIEGRVKILETIVDKVSPVKTYEEFRQLQQEFHDQQLTSKERVRMAAATASIITFVLNIAAILIGILTGVLKFTH